MTLGPVQFSGKKTLFATCALSVLLTLPCVCAADTVSTAEWNISADRIIRYQNPKSIVAEGNIVLTKRVELPPQVAKPQQEVTDWAVLLGEPEKKSPEVTAKEVEEAALAPPRYQTALEIRADWMAYDVDRQSIKARGHVKVVHGDDTLYAEKGNVSLKTETGAFANAVILRKENEIHLEGKKVEKTGVDTYHIEDGWVVTCPIHNGKTPPWSFASKDTDIRQGGYAVLKHATFNIKGVPVFYTPYMILPVKNTRQTGFLFPELSHSDNSGFGINIPFFWNISDSMDLTLFPQYYANRGIMPGLEFRYVTNDTDKGMFIGNYLDDPLSDPSETEYYADTGFTHTNSDRYWLRGKADQEFGDDWQARLDLDVVSDRDYLTEFNSGYTGFDASNTRFQDIFGRGFEDKTTDNRTNSMKLLKTWDGISLETNFQAINDVRADKSSPTPLWKLPDINFNGVLPIGETGLSFNWNSEYVDYYREDGIGAHRVDIHPTISTPIPLSPYLESRAQLGLRDTFYQVEEYGDATWDNSNTQNRFLGDFEMEVGTTLVRDFALSGDGNRSFSHQVHPYVQYNYIPDVNQDDLPSLDDVDSIDKTNSITYGVDNFFNLLSNGSTRDLGYAKISQTYESRKLGLERTFLRFAGTSLLHPDRAAGAQIRYLFQYVWQRIRQPQL